MKTNISISVFIISVVCFVHQAYANNNQTRKQSDVVVYRSEDLDKQEALALYAPVNFSGSGVRGYLRNVYNNQEYTQEILPNDFSHLVQFLNNGKKTKQSRAYAKSVFKLFGNKLKAAHYVNAYAFSDMIEQMPLLLEDYFLLAKSNSMNKHKENVTSILYSTFLSKYDYFKKNPQDFFDDLSQDILHALENELTALNDDVTMDQLRQSMVRFLEIGLNKLVWSVEEPEKIWDSVKTISQQLERLMEHNVIDDADDLDDLYWSLVHRLCYFIEIAGPELPFDFYEKIKTEVSAQQVIMFDLEEQEAALESKSQKLMNVLVMAQAKKQATERGIVVR